MAQSYPGSVRCAFAGLWGRRRQLRGISRRL